MKSMKGNKMIFKLITKFNAWAAAHLCEGAWWAPLSLNQTLNFLGML